MTDTGARVAWIGLGANLGDRVATLEAAFDALAAVPATRLVARSGLWSSAPVDAGGPDFLNAVARVETRLSPHELLAMLLAIEARFGRERSYHNAPRTLDLDLLMHGDSSIDSPGLVLPHPRLHLRAFVLRPLAELDPGLVVPGIGPLADRLPAVAGQRCEPWRPEAR